MEAFVAGVTALGLIAMGIVIAVKIYDHRQDGQGTAAPQQQQLELTERKNAA